MIRDVLEAAFREYRERRERPFWRMVQLFVARIFRGGGDSDADGLDLGVGLVLTLLAMPGGFVSLLLLNKYGTLLQWLRGIPNVDPLLITLPDEYFFIVLSMTVTGAVALWRWDAIFPDRRDYMNLVPLPISTPSIFRANLVAIVFLAGLIAVDVNAASCILFPAVVEATQKSLLFFVKFGLVHTLVVMLASVFAFFAVFSVLGFLMAVLPARVFRRVSTYVRGIVVVYLVAMLCTSFAVPVFLRGLKGAAPAWTLLTPSCWFLGLCQALNGRAGPALVQLSKLAFPGTALVAALALFAYAVSYHRHFVRIPETTEITDTTHASRISLGGVLLDRVALPTQFQRGCFRFVITTMVRSEPHRLVLTAVGGLGLVLTSQALMGAFEGGRTAHAAALSPDALSIPFILSFLAIVGLRMVFDVPVELRANWIFQLMLDENGQECERLARKVILILVLPPLLLITFPPYFYLEGWIIAGLHTMLVVVWAVLLTNIALVRFRKLPFTCTLPLFKQHSIVTFLSCCFGFLIYAVETPEFESSALLESWRMLSVVPVAAVAWYVPHHLAKSAIDVERKLIFEESPTQTIEVLRLSD
ncbi:MAG TPA: hypothetical protein VFL34_03340 [Candidatus Sulfotelmatobacter sp.]|nr:hypothetical protein [Candidatus Sulfotelmatobacter sp.]